MNLNSLFDSLKYINNFGHVMSTEEQIILNNSLVILQNENHFQNVYFWGKILGIENDYYIAYGYVHDALDGRIFYYSLNGIDWWLLPKPTERGLELTSFCTTLFEGDPALVITIQIEPNEIGFTKNFKHPKIKKLKEEDRLAAVVNRITNEATIIPRGGLFRRTDGVVVENLTFEGLNRLESRELVSYLHYRKPTRKYNTNLLVREDYNYAMDFLDPLDIDIPQGCWTIQLTPDETMVTVKSLYWPGFLFYHFIKTPKYGFVYFGDGKRSYDVPFAITPLLG